MSDYYEVQLQKRYDNNNPKFLENLSKKRTQLGPQEQLRNVQTLKNMIGASVNLALKDKSCCNDDNFLLRFLYARKFQCEEALELLIAYFLFKERNKALLHKISIFDESIQQALRDGNPRVLRQRDRRGRKVITLSASNWDPSSYTLEDIYRALLLSLDKLLENLQNQALGFVIIVDWTNVTFRQSTFLSPKILKLMIEGLQDCMPIRFKGIHLIAQPWYVEIALAVIKPFLKEKSKKRLMTHGTNLTTLHSLINKDVLPPDLGGEGPSISTLDWYHYLLESSQSSESPKTYRLIEATLYSRAPTANNSLCDMDTKTSDPLIL